MNTILYEPCLGATKLEAQRLASISTGRCLPSCKSFTASIGLQREVFDVTNHEHLKQYKLFKETGRWVDAKSFKIEWPFASVVSTVEAKIVAHVLGSTVA